MDTLSCIVVGIAAQTPDEGREPPLILSVEIDGKTTPIELDKPVSIDAPAGKMTLTVRAQPHRLFGRAGVSFRYPRHYTFEADLKEKEVSIWSLSGVDHVIMVHRYNTGGMDSSVLLGNVVDGLIQRFGRKHVQQSNAAIEFAGKKLTGKKLDTTLAGSHLRQSIFVLPVSQKQPVILILQDAPLDDGSPSPESQATEKMLRDSFRFEPK